MRHGLLTSAARCAVVLLVLTSALAPAAAAERAVIQLGTLTGSDYVLRDVVLELTSGMNEARLLVGALELPEPLQHWRTLRVDCAPVAIAVTAVDCPRARLQLGLAQGAAVSVEGDIKVRRQAGGLELRAEALRVAGAELSVQLFVRADDWRLRVDGTPLDAAVLGRLLGDALAGVRLSAGRLRVALDARREANELEASLTLDGQGLDFADASAQLAGEAVQAQLQLRVAGPVARAALDAELTVSAGIAGHDPVFIEAAGPRPVSASASGLLHGAGPSWQALDLRSLSLRQPGVLQLAGSARLPLAEPAAGGAEGLRLDLTWQALQLQSFYDSVLEPHLYGSALAGLRLQGGLRGELRHDSAAGLRSTVRLDDVTLRAHDELFDVTGLDAELGFDSRGARMPVTVAWQAARLLRLDLGASRLDGHSLGDRLRVDAPLRVPLLDGALRVEGLQVDGMFSAAPSWRFRGELEPLSMARLAAALDWPPFGGSVAGVLPEVVYADDRVELHGTLQAQLFDGVAELGRLALERPLGVAPRLEADVVLRDLSLAALTGAFSFGTIQGRLDGEVRDLVLENWQPTAFDARLSSPTRRADGLRRISQRAVRNLSSIGGGPGVGALSQAFLGFFEDFSYARLGLACRLRAGVCEMDGVAPAENGYYIVEGAGLPRIDVIGFNRRVDWAVLVDRLQRAAESGGPIIE